MLWKIEIHPAIKILHLVPSVLVIEIEPDAREMFIDMEWYKSDGIRSTEMSDIQKSSIHRWTQRKQGDESMSDNSKEMLNLRVEIIAIIQYVQRYLP
jgi:hypothetical protein